jgi:predicted lipoprotein with Yx(FWY)xxD motif
MRSTLIVAITAGLALMAAGTGVAAPTVRASDHASLRSLAGTTVTVRTSRYGRVLFDGQGRALYLFTADRSTRSTCYGACAKAWPPFLVKAKPVAGRGVSARLLGTTRRRGGTVQVTYAGHPLYYYEGDGRGQIKCQNVSEFGGLWLVVTPGGKAVR